jgi:hypothetical protein
LVNIKLNYTFENLNAMYCAHCHRTCACCASTVAAPPTSEQQHGPSPTGSPVVQSQQVQSQQVHLKFDFEHADFLSSAFLEKHAQAGMLHLHKHVQGFGVAVVRSVYQTMQRAEEQNDPHIAALFVPSASCTLGEFAVHHVLKNEDVAKQRKRKNNKAKIDIHV